MESVLKIKSRWIRSFFTALDLNTDEEKYICDICHKDLGSPANLALHRNAHEIERPFKCSICAASFDLSVKLQKHLNSTAHKERYNLTQVYGAPTEQNPRPFKCHLCRVAFRKSGHLSKHLNSKSHLTKLETDGASPDNKP